MALDWNGFYVRYNGSLWVFEADLQTIENVQSNDRGPDKQLNWLTFWVIYRVLFEKTVP